MRSLLNAKAEAVAAERGGPPSGVRAHGGSNALNADRATIAAPAIAMATTMERG